MRGAEHRLLDGEAGFVRAEQHGAASGEVVRLVEHPLVVRLEQPPRVAREQIGHPAVRTG